jgi:hypothetical protein
MANRKAETSLGRGRKACKTETKKGNKVVKAEPSIVKGEPSTIQDMSKRLPGTPNLATIFEPGKDCITRNLMTYLSQADVEKLKATTEGFDPQFHDNLKYVPPPK